MQGSIAWGGVLVVLVTAGCASNDRLMDAQVRPADRGECALNSTSSNHIPAGVSGSERAVTVRSPRDSRCSAPDDARDGLYWSSDGGESMKVDFSGRHGE